MSFIFSDNAKLLGQTFSLLIIQDFEALTPNILARLIECVEGCGMIIFLMSNVHTLKDLYHLNMRDVKLPKSESQCVLNQSFDCFSKVFSVCCTKDQINALTKFAETLKERFIHTVVSLTSARGRGKSATLGLAVAIALYLKYSNIYVTSPHLENLQTLFSFLIKGLQELGFKEGADYQIQSSQLENARFINGIKIFRIYPGAVRYLPPTDFCKLGNAELIVIDEAAAIPLPVVKEWLGFCTVFMASTINGYEGTGRSLSLKLLSQLRNQCTSSVSSEKGPLSSNEKAYILKEITLNQAIRYSDGDFVEAWLNNLLCLDVSVATHMMEAFPSPESCELYYVNRDVLFNYHKSSEAFLQKLVALFVSSHYKNTPNDLMMMADAPAHHIFCLLPSVHVDCTELPSILCAIQVSLEGKISKESVLLEHSHGKRASGDLIPWIISQQFQDAVFPSLSSARIVRIATHPDCQKMGYGQRALELLCGYYRRKVNSLNALVNMDGKESNKINPTNSLQSETPQALLLRLQELHPCSLDYVGVSYGLTPELLKFWKKCGFSPLYIRQTASDVTGEFSCIMVKCLHPVESKESNWLTDFCRDFLERFINLLPISFKTLSASLILNIIHLCSTESMKRKDFSSAQLQWFLTPRSMQRLNAYCNRLVDYHLIMDLLPVISKLYFLHHPNNFSLSSVQEVVLLSMGFQNKSVEQIAVELNMEAGQVMGVFMKTMKRILQWFNSYNIVSEENANKKNSILNSNSEEFPNLQSHQAKRSKNSHNSARKKQKFEETINTARS
ncbi:RNA cytidine acetyltransferase-like isoform X2 [Stegodyphus dumicola]|uniref:RNA cytidine acetyltransferase-like isoform X2 n=1 Tax=Stegodyphus dumicola TaxID=202533 RepID=UPI0015AAF1BF|nr:RNA cytidine acetyltransferase-like isoform X2 [Stegodyphus dumicola]